MKTEITWILSHKSLMNKSKSELADMVLQYADFNGELHNRITTLENRVREYEEDTPPTADAKLLASANRAMREALTKAQEENEGLQSENAQLLKRFEFVSNQDRQRIETARKDVE